MTAFSLLPCPPDLTPAMSTSSPIAALRFSTSSWSRDSRSGCFSPAGPACTPCPVFNAAHRQHLICQAAQFTRFAPAPIHDIGPYYLPWLCLAQAVPPVPPIPTHPPYPLRSRFLCIYFFVLLLVGHRLGFFFCFFTVLGISQLESVPPVPPARPALGISIHHSSILASLIQASAYY